MIGQSGKRMQAYQIDDGPGGNVVQVFNYTGLPTLSADKGRIGKQTDECEPLALQ
ncbi:hypothetical protein PSQ90_07095 [Devosia rhodophyticola]|uniref:Uncharacterized protein n=1 Tax=Devosia rhodophyticola TaxID=3026423 RepID=A0ABY7Z2G5_9HYPH|nr:hypothetical protein [Devosia rhodophyticola]WDR07185.1 hypothetical protein PSQ90_07095 [Devosia rhodophyticola]